VAALSAGVDAGAFTSVEITLHRQDGRPFRSLVCLVPLVDGDGGVAVWCEVHCDLEEKRKGSDEAFLARWAEQVGRARDRGGVGVAVGKREGKRQGRR
jgi:hypothetical protein